MGKLSDFALAPAGCRRRMEELLAARLSVDGMRKCFLSAKALLRELVDLAAREGEEERKAVEFGLADWPDVEPLD